MTYWVELVANWDQLVGIGGQLGANWGELVANLANWWPIGGKHSSYEAPFPRLSPAHSHKPCLQG